MNRTKIDWADWTWNAVTGCLHNCDYCYARRIAERFGGPDGFKPTFHEERLSEPLWVKKPSRIFVCSMADLFGEWVPADWITHVLAACEAASQHQYLFLTKNPARYLAAFGDRRLIAHWWLGATCTTREDTLTVTQELAQISAMGWHTWVSAEPLLEDIAPYIEWDYINWLVIGAMTGPGSKNRQPKADWVYDLTAHAIVHHIPVFQKQSLKQFDPLRDLTQEYPKAML